MRDEAFENYLKSLHKFNFRKDAFLFCLDDEGNYDLPDVRELHHAWQASSSREGTRQVPEKALSDLKGQAESMMRLAHCYQDETHIKSFARGFLHIHSDLIGEKNGSK